MVRGKPGQYFCIHTHNSTKSEDVMGSLNPMPPLGTSMQPHSVVLQSSFLLL